MSEKDAPPTDVPPGSVKPTVSGASPLSGIPLDPTCVWCDRLLDTDDPDLCKACRGLRADCEVSAGHFDTYQQFTARTSNGTLSPICGALGLCGESGEVADLIKKAFYHRTPLDTDKLKLELGDVLWYLARTADAFGWTLSDVARANNYKLARRYPRGFSPEASLARRDA